MTVKILFLYYDIMNLYGENGNIRILEQRLKDQGAEVVVDRKSLTDNSIIFEDYDFIYCGSGTELSRNACLMHLLNFSDSLKNAFEDGKVMLFTGNAYEMLGKSIDENGKIYNGLNVFDFTVSEETKRFTGDVIAKSGLFDQPFVGFINKCSHTSNVENPFLTVEKIIGTVDDKTDGIHENNFFGTHLIGPVLVKNPHFAEYITQLILSSVNKDFEYKKQDYKYQQAGYEITKSELMKV